MEKRYTVTQAAEMTGVKSYVLRYWEDELDLRIGRNELGHRYYTGYDIQLFLNIKEYILYISDSNLDILDFQLVYQEMTFSIPPSNKTCKYQVLFLRSLLNFKN